MKVLVTGGAGFIGSYVVDAYIAAGFDVAVVDNCMTGHRENVNPRASYYEVDIRSPELKSVFEKERPEVVNHHAAQASVAVSVRDPQLDADINIIGSLNLYHLCITFKVRRVIFASTGGAIYGNPKSLPVDERHREEPLAPYGITKLTAEAYLRYFGSLGLEFAILRYANIYGPRQDPYGEAGVVAIFTQAMLEGGTPVIFGDGTQTRDFLYVDDAARANVLATTASNSNLANISTGIEISVNQIYHRLLDLANAPETVKYADPRPGEVYRIALKPERARQWLGWNAEVDLSEGLRRTMEWYRARSRP